MSSTTSDPFMATVHDFIGLSQVRLLEAYRATALDALARVKELTPVSTGTLRANWTIILDGDPLPVVGQAQDPTEALQRLRLGDEIILANPVIYARRIEFGFVGEDSLGRRYNQKGVAMMQQTIAEMPSIAAAAIARVQQEPA